MTGYREYFKDKKITVMGLGLLGRGVGDIAFLAECGAVLIVTDLKTEEDLLPSLQKLKKFKNITYHLGGHRFEDFKNVDLVIKSAGVPLDSPYITFAQKNNIPVKMSTALFAKFSPGTVIGITGTRGKSTVTHLIYEILKTTGTNVYLGGNIRGMATLPLLKKVKENDFIVLELDSWQLQGFGEEKISPHISIFTTFLPDHLNYYKNDLHAYFSDKANIFLYQKKDDYLILGKSVKTLIKKQYEKNIKAKIISPALAPSQLTTSLLGAHNRENISLALAVARILNIKEVYTKKAIKNFTALPGRLEFVREVKGVKYYNDTNATTPDAVIAALNALKTYSGKILLIGGGADKNLSYESYAKIVPKYVKKIILFKGLATEKIISLLPKKVKSEIIIVENMKEAFKESLKKAKKGNVVLLSPGAASFGVFKNEYDRGDQFNKLAKKIK